MNRLLDIGFLVAGDWFLEDGALRIAFRQHAEQRNVLYSGRPSKKNPARISGFKRVVGL
ncbi:hypothetical protein [Paraburkholderia lycopersici]|uniref:Uncharacterized protein n=1 Tax=Paraburkholderia lycopersici TaxID=416944 RepID=A0A1G6MLR8_9BURK|nr:hypothetical protein [Paraburkholderia lycopersici]SDC56449.1 hypothetical protein SAMN05421548_10813 [Paraburkholderia lycopersici]